MPACPSASDAACRCTVCCPHVCTAVDPCYWLPPTPWILVAAVEVLLQPQQGLRAGAAATLAHTTALRSACTRTCTRKLLRMERRCHQVHCTSCTRDQSIPGGGAHKASTQDECRRGRGRQVHSLWVHATQVTRQRTCAWRCHQWALAYKAKQYLG